MYYVWGGRASCNIQQAREAVGEASTACSQRRPHLRVCVHELKPSFVTAGWWIHTVPNTTGRTLTQLLSLSHTQCYTQTNTCLSTVGLCHTQKLFFYLHHKTNANTHARTHTLWLDRCFSLGHTIWTFTSSVQHTHKHTCTQTAALCTGLPWNRMVILHYGSTVIWGEWALQTNGNPHTNTHRRGYCKCV